MKVAKINETGRNYILKNRYKFKATSVIPVPKLILPNQRIKTITVVVIIVIIIISGVVTSYITSTTQVDLKWNQRPKTIYQQLTENSTEDSEAEILCEN